MSHVDTHWKPLLCCGNGCCTRAQDCKLNRKFQASQYKKSITIHDLTSVQIDGSGIVPVEFPDDDCHGSHKDAGLYIGGVG